MAATVEQTLGDLRGMYADRVRYEEKCRANGWHRNGVRPLVPLEPTDLYEVTIIQTRYGGSYEGGRWAASHGPLPDEAFGEDPVCDSWWSDEAAEVSVGVGDTPDAALAALIGKLEAGLADG